MNYQKHYDLLIERARSRSKPNGYVERHHIIPLCLGGDSERSNLVDLTAREHYIAHQLLVKLNPKNRSLLFAAKNMTCNLHGKRNNRLYAWLREKFSVYIKEVNKGKKLPPRTEEHCKNLSESLTGRKKSKRSEEHCRKIGERSKGNKYGSANKGRPLSEFHKIRLREGWVKRKTKGI